ncbi:MAG: SDR family NAD(P)-dependent oxidoreductase, partial [Thaumarchaeota archaeon]|nr:SDR family NAD(P)-dependent oxidoreductase [Nitrososphaerota archaeon]
MTGASGGLGTPLVQALASLGVEVEAVYYRHPIARTDAIYPAKVDVSNPYLVAQFFDEIEPFDHLVLCHGVTSDSIGCRMTTSTWKHVVDTNLSGSFYCLRSGVSKMNDGGVVVAVSSVAARGGIYGAANYAASKTGLGGL